MPPLARVVKVGNFPRGFLSVAEGTGVLTRWGPLGRERESSSPFRSKFAKSLRSQTCDFENFLRAREMKNPRNTGENTKKADVWRVPDDGFFE